MSFAREDFLEMHHNEPQPQLDGRAPIVPQARLLGRPSYHVPTPAECGGVPDPYALLETVRGG